MLLFRIHVRFCVQFLLHVNINTELLSSGSFWIATSQTILAKLLLNRLILVSIVSQLSLLNELETTEFNWNLMPFDWWSNFLITKIMLLYTPTNKNPKKKLRKGQKMAKRPPERAFFANHNRFVFDVCHL